MLYLGMGTWLITAVLAYFVAQAVVLCCDRRDWDHDHKLIIGLGSLLLGPVALLLAVKAWLFIMIAKEADHRFTLHFHR